MADKTHNGKKGGLLEGKRHYAKDGTPLGGIKAIVTDTGQHVELEGGEVIINREASKKHWRELSKINQSAGNGVPILPPDTVEADTEQYKKGGVIIDFNPNIIPTKWVYEYGKKVRDNYPKVWEQYANVYGNEAFENLGGALKRGYWLDGEEWFYYKWKAFDPKHKGNATLKGVLASLKWCTINSKGWAYMKSVIDKEIKRLYPKAEKLAKGKKIKEEVKAKTYKEWIALMKADNNAHNKNAHEDDVIPFWEWVWEMGSIYGFKPIKDSGGDTIIIRTHNNPPNKAEVLKYIEENRDVYADEDGELDESDEERLAEDVAEHFNITIGDAFDYIDEPKMKDGGNLEEFVPKQKYIVTDKELNYKRIAIYIGLFTKKGTYHKFKDITKGTTFNIHPNHLNHYEIIKAMKDGGKTPDDDNIESANKYIKKNGLIFRFNGDALQRGKKLSKSMAGHHRKVVREILSGIKKYELGGKTPILTKESEKHLAPTFITDTEFHSQIRQVEATTVSVEEINSLLTNIGLPFKVTKELGTGASGTAFLTNRKTVLKVTNESAEAYTSYIISISNFKNQAKVHNVFKITDGTRSMYFIEKELVKVADSMPKNEPFPLDNLFLEAYNECYPLGDITGSIRKDYTDKEIVEIANGYYTQWIELFEDKNGEKREFTKDEVVGIKELKSKKKYIVEKLYNLFTFYRDIEKEGEEQDLDYNDVHAGNFGEVNGKFVCFDCISGGEKSFMLGGEIAKGIKVEKEHNKTLEKLFNHKITPQQAPKYIAKDHLKEDEKYYTKLDEMESKFSRGSKVPENNVEVGDEATYLERGNTTPTRVVVLSQRIAPRGNKHASTVRNLATGKKIEIYTDRLTKVGGSQQKPQGLPKFKQGEYVVSKRERDAYQDSKTGHWSTYKLYKISRKPLQDGNTGLWEYSMVDVNDEDGIAYHEVPEASLVGAILYGNLPYRVGDELRGKDGVVYNVFDIKPETTYLNSKERDVETTKVLRNIAQGLWNVFSSSETKFKVHDLVMWEQMKGNLRLVQIQKAKVGADTNVYDFVKTDGTTGSNVPEMDIVRVAEDSDLKDLFFNRVLVSARLGNYEIVDVAQPLPKKYVLISAGGMDFDFTASDLFDLLSGLQVNEYHLQKENEKPQEEPKEVSFAIQTPSGEKSKLTYLQQVLVRTDAFKQYFGDWEASAKAYIKDPVGGFDKHFKGVSKVVDLITFEPRLMFHGTMAKEEFFVFEANRTDVARPYAYFARNKEYAENFTNISQRGGNKPFLYECFLRVLKPFMAISMDYEAKQEGWEYWLDKLAETLSWDKYGSEYTTEQYEQTHKVVESQIGKYIKKVCGNDKIPFWRFMANDNKSVFKVFLMSHDYDGVEYGENIGKDYDINNPAQYTAATTLFDSDQIKLADGRNLDFSLINQDIRFEDGGALSEENSEVVPTEKEPTQQNLTKTDQLGRTLFGEKYMERGGGVYATKEPKALSEDRSYVEDLISKMKD